MGSVVKSFDDGYGDNKGFDGENEIIIPSFVTKWKAIPEEELGRGRYSDPLSHITVEYDGKKVLIGEAAQRLDKVGGWIGEENKHKSRQFISMAKGQLALLCRYDLEKEVSIDYLVMGLPIDQDTPDRKKGLASIVKGRHEVKVTLANGEVIDKIIHVNSVVFVTQPFGSFAFKALNNNGEIKDELLNNRITTIFDLGARTLNVLTLQGFTPIPSMSFTKPLGLYGAWQSIQEDIKDVHGKDLPIARIPSYCKEGMISGINIEKLRDENYADHVDMLLTVFGTELVHNKGEIDDIILTGGGSEVLSKWLVTEMKERFAQANVTALNRTATVKGYYNFGMRKARSNKLTQQQEKTPVVPANRK